jgi:hypothetical protein
MRAPVPLLALAWLVALGACGGGLPASAVARPVGEDLVALLPAGCELVVDVDLLQLRNWDEMERVLGLLPPTGRARLDRLGPHWLNELDALALGMWRNDSRTQSVIVLRGDLDDTKMAALLDGDATPGQLEGRAMWKSANEVALRIGKRLIVVGDEVEARRVEEIVRGDAQGLRDTKSDRAIRDAIAKAPTARTGRPAVIGGLIGGPLLGDRYDAAGFKGRAPNAAAFAIAVGDGVDAVLILALGSPAEAASLRADFERSLRELRSRPIIRILGLQNAFDVASVVRGQDLRVAYRVAGDRLAGFLDRLDQAKKIYEANRAAPPDKKQ